MWLDLNSFLAENIVPEGETDLQKHLIKSQLQRSEMITGFICWTCFWIVSIRGMSLEFCFVFWLPVDVELNNNQMPQTSRVIPGETKKRFAFRTPGLLQFSGLLWSHFWGCAPVLLKVWNWTPLFIYSILRVIYCFPCVYLSEYGLSVGISDLILEMWSFLACSVVSEALLALSSGDCRNELTFINRLQKHCLTCGVYSHSVRSISLAESSVFREGDCVALV